MEDEAMPRKTFGDGSPIEGEPLDETCPECGGELVRTDDLPQVFGEPDRHRVRCRDCKWKEDRPNEE